MCSSYCQFKHCQGIPTKKEEEIIYDIIVIQSFKRIFTEAYFVGA
jgi:hypothetical protein